MNPLIFEHTLFRTRTHPIVFLFSIMPHVILLTVPPLVFSIISTRGITLPYSEMELFPLIAVMAGSIYYFYVLLFLLYAFFDYFLDVWTITNHHIINIEQKSMFLRTISKQELERVQDVTSEIKGIFGTFFNYGTVEVQTAGAQERVVFEKVPMPQTVVDVILRAVKRRKDEIARENDDKQGNGL